MERITLHIDQLVINPDINPRHATDDGVSDLVAQIKANGFSDALWVRPVSKSFEKRARLLNPSTRTGEQLFEVIDGSRRLRAMRQLHEEGGFNYQRIECDLIEADDARARELALAANVARAPLSAADEARAFYALKLGGMGEDQIAAHFAVPVSRVRQRLAIGQLPDPIIDALRAGKLSRDQLALISVEINPDEPVAKGKKPEMVAAVLPLIEKSGWLPPQLRTPSYRGPGSEHWPPKEETAGEAQAQDQAA